MVKTPHTIPIAVQMADHNEDELNVYNRKTMPDLLAASLRAANQAYYDVGRPTADVVLPSLSEHTMGQLLQMLMLATIVEGRLMGINPYSGTGTEVYRRHQRKSFAPIPRRRLPAARARRIDPERPSGDSQQETTSEA